MNVEEKMIEFIVDEATQEQVEEFFGYENHDFTREDCEEVLAQMPDEIFFKLFYGFGFRFIASDILWDTEEEDVELPKQYVMPEWAHEEEDAAEYITAQSGFCHAGFSFDCKREYRYRISLCNGSYCGGEITVYADRENEAEEEIAEYIGKKLNEAFPELDIEYSWELQ